jgi:hypothetical protein
VKAPAPTKRCGSLQLRLRLRNTGFALNRFRGFDTYLYSTEIRGGFPRGALISVGIVKIKYEAKKHVAFKLHWASKQSEPSVYYHKM